MNLEHVRWVWSRTSGFRGQLLLYLVLELFSIACSLVFVYLSKRAVDSSLLEGGEYLKKLLVGVVISVVLGLATRLLASWINERTRISMTLMLQREMVDSQMISVWSVVKQWHSGDIQVRIQTDCMEVANMLSNAAISALVTLCRILGSFWLLWTLDPMLALIIVAITPLFLFSKLYFKKMQDLTKKIKREDSIFGKILQENLRFRMLIRGMGFLSARQKILCDTQDRIFGLKMEQLNFSTFTQAFMKSTLNVGYLVTFIWGIYRLHTGYISFGSMTAFLQLVGRIQPPVLSLIGFVPTFIRFKVSLERLIELHNSPKEEEPQPTLLSDVRSVLIKNLSFKYEDTYVIRDFNATMERGEPVAVIGSSGKGKTTFVRLLLSLIRPGIGSIQITTAEKVHAVTAEHRVNFTYVPQGNSLFTGSIRDNLVIANSMATDDEINKAVHLACAEFIYTLPDGLDTLVSESGYGISEGQAQRIAIARALLKQQYSILVLDECTASLDKDTSDRLVRNLIDMNQDKILIFITHDQSLLEHCSKIINMR